MWVKVPLIFEFDESSLETENIGSKNTGRKYFNISIILNSLPPNILVMKKTILFLFFFLLLNTLVLDLYAQTFTRVDAIAGISQVAQKNGVAVADYDQDGDLDIFFTGINNFNVDDPHTWNRLMKNNGDGTFQDATIEAGFDKQYTNTDILAARGEKMGASWGDYDNDGYPDLFLANSREDQLYRNVGDGTFVDVTQQAGVGGCHGCYSSCGQWWDHDRDGDLDLYVSILNGPNLMYENKGDGTFKDISGLSGLSGSGITWSSVSLDVGKDGILDLYVINDTQLNEFYENRTGVSYNQANRAYRLEDEGAGMGVAIGDPNNDGFFDIYVTNIYNNHPNPLFINQGNLRFEDKAEAFGVADTGWGWGTHFFDCDHDGDEDLYAVNGPIDKLFGDEQPNINNVFFKNMTMEGNERFIDWSTESHTNELAKGKGMEVFDYDNDGDLDIVVANMEEGVYLFRNETIGAIESIDKNWIQIKLEGTTSNRNAFGTTVKIRIGEQSYYRWHHGAAVFGQSIKPVHFGVGNAEMIDEIQITWLSGVLETYFNVEANQIIKITEGAGLTHTKEISSVPFKISNYPNPFSQSTNLIFDTHKAGNLSFKIFSALGPEVFQHNQPHASAGQYQIVWDGKDNKGNNLATGIYFYTAFFDNYQINGKLLKTRN